MVYHTTTIPLEALRYGTTVPSLAPFSYLPLEQAVKTLGGVLGTRTLAAIETSTFTQLPRHLQNSRSNTTAEYVCGGGTQEGAFFSPTGQFRSCTQYRIYTLSTVFTKATFHEKSLET